MVTNRSRKRFVTPLRVLIVLVVAALVIAGLELTNTTHLFHKSPSKVVVTVGKPVVPPKKSSSSSSTASQPAPPKSPTGNNLVQSGGAIDNKGSCTPTARSSQWVTSQSRLITVKSPVANTTLKDGDQVIGSAGVNLVDYRLIDNTVGVLAQGTLSVVNGNFCGTLHFQPKGTGGRLDIYSTNTQGVEYNEIQINVSF